MDTVKDLRNEVNCRIEHGADSNGHLEFVQSRLDAILKAQAETPAEWIKHDGGNLPIDRCDTMVVAANKNIEAKLRDGTVKKLGLAGKIKWPWDKMYPEFDIVEFRILPQEDKPAPKKQYKLSEMWKVWYHFLRYDVDDTDIEECGIQQTSFIHLHQAKKWAQHCSECGDTPVAITRADATEFYEGQNLQQED